MVLYWIGGWPAVVWAGAVRQARGSASRLDCAAWPASPCLRACLSCGLLACLPACLSTWLRAVLSKPARFALLLIVILRRC